MTARMNNRSRAWWGLVAALAVASASLGLSAPAQAGPSDLYTVKGTVVADTTGAPVAGSSVNVMKDGVSYGYASTNSDGQFSVSVRGDSAYTLQIWPFYDPAVVYARKDVPIPLLSDNIDLGTIVLDRQLICSTNTTATGTLHVGDTLKASSGTITPSDVTSTVSYQWARLAPDYATPDSALVETPIPGATGSTYTLTSADEGTQIRIGSEATAPSRGTAVCEPLITRIVVAAIPAPAAVSPSSGVTAVPAVPGAAAPVVVGRSKVGKRLTAQAAAPGAMESYQWLRNGKPVAGATTPTFKITKASKGKRISVVVTYAREGYAAVVITSPVKKIKK